MTNQPVKLLLYAERCLRCKALVEHATKTFTSCHHSAGNKACPASSVRVVVNKGTALLRQQILQALVLPNADQRASALSQLAEQNPKTYPMQFARAAKQLAKMKQIEES